jgi:hypothetical protein
VKWRRMPTARRYALMKLQWPTIATVGKPAALHHPTKTREP